MGRNLREGGSVQGNQLIRTQQLGWEKLMLWLTAPVLQGWRAAVALGSLVLCPYLVPSRTEREKANGLKGKWLAEKERQPQTDRRARASTVSHPCVPRGTVAEVLGLREVSLHMCLAASPLGSAIPVTPAHAGQCPLHCSWPTQCRWRDVGGMLQALLLIG